MSDRPTLVCITGPTASGKSSLAMELAERLGAEILSVDSMQVYRGFDIGTAKPTALERARVPHHGLDLVDAHETFSAGAWVEHAREVIETATSNSRRVLAVGGTGLYFRALLGGLTPAAPASPEVRKRIRDRELEEPGSSHRLLQEADPVAAARIHPNDQVRTERALEVWEITGEPLSSWQAKHAWSESPYDSRAFGIRWDRGELRQRIAQRVDRMLEQGWIEEVRGLVEAGVTEDATPMKALGYREIAAHLRGEVSLSQLRDRIVTVSGQFAKRQSTWFNREPSVRWLDPAPDLGEQLLVDLEPLFSGAASRTGGPT